LPTVTTISISHLMNLLIGFTILYLPSLLDCLDLRYIGSRLEDEHIRIRHLLRNLLEKSVGNPLAS
jgi:hypothetical protein